MGYIYTLKNSITNKIYVGATTRTPEKRYREHITESKRSRAKDRKLYKDIIIYGINTFQLATINQYKDADLFEKEKYYIELYDSFRNGYNETTGGKGKSFTDVVIIKDVIESYKNNRYTLEKMSKQFNLCKDTIKFILSENNIKVKTKYSIIDFGIKVSDKDKNERNFINFDECVKWLVNKKDLNTTKQIVKDGILRAIYKQRNTYYSYEFSRI